MTDAWHVHDTDVLLTGDQAVQLIHDRISRGELTVWLESATGRTLAVVSNGSRALVMLLEEPSDAGEHAIDPARTGEMGGYVLENGQHDTYANADTVELAVALTIVKHIVDHGHPPPNAAWHVDR